MNNNSIYKRQRIKYFDYDTFPSIKRTLFRFSGTNIELHHVSFLVHREAVIIAEKKTKRFSKNYANLTVVYPALTRRSCGVTFSLPHAEHDKTSCGQN